MAKRGRKPARRPVVKAGDDRWRDPPHLDGEALEAWRHVVGLLRDMGSLDRTDPSLVEAYAMTRAMLRQAHELVSAGGLVAINSRGGEVLNPACNVLNFATMRLKAIVNELGLSPASSKGATGNRAETKQDDKWGGLLGVVGG